MAGSAIKKAIAVCICILVAVSAAGCGSGSSLSSAQSSAVQSSASSDTVLTVRDRSGDVTRSFTQADLNALDKETHTYSGRSKKDNNKREIKKYTGAELRYFLQEAGISGAKEIKVVCDDEYTKEYEVSDLYDLYAFKNETGPAKTKVPPIITLKDRQLIIGQADYDGEDTKDFNMQNWARGICTIEEIE